MGSVKERARSGDKPQVRRGKPPARDKAHVGTGRRIFWLLFPGPGSCRSRFLCFAHRLSLSLFIVISLPSGPRPLKRFRRVPPPQTGSSLSGGLERPTGHHPPGTDWRRRLGSAGAPARLRA